MYSQTVWPLLALLNNGSTDSLQFKGQSMQYDPLDVFTHEKFVCILCD